MSESVTPLDPLQFPLRGRRLIEASAGTGKTWTIAALYLRLVLGHGGGHAFSRPLLPPEILVVTFTNAATRELRERIWARLAEAARVFRGQVPPPDPFLKQLLAEPDYAADDARARAALQLDRAAQWMDEAAIYTIHGWSQRMLNQHAFDSGSLFDQTLDNDEEQLRQEAVRDYWRTFCYPLPEPALRALASLARTPTALAARIAPLLGTAADAAQVDGQPIPAARSPLAFAADLEAWQQRLDELETDARQHWCEAVDEIEPALQQAVTGGVLSKTSYKLDRLPEYFAQMRRWASGDVSDYTLLARFTVSKLRNSTNKKFREQGPPQHAAFEALEMLLAQRERAPDLTPVLHHAAGWVQNRFDLSKRTSARLGFDDLLGRLDQALANPKSGPRLARAIAQQYPVALIDEFQDTDPIQYRSFSRIYTDAEADGSALLLIGDPKQAIYAFRGADIHTYLEARRDCAGALYTLDTNYRSAESLVAAVNQLFLQAEQTAPQGAFRFARAGDNPLPFHPVAAKGCSDRLEIDGKTPAALTGWWLEPEDVATKADFLRHYAERCASEIQRVLALAAEQRAGLRQADGALVALKPSDMAVLVRTGTEAQAIRQALAARGVRSVYLSDRESVFASEEAVDLWRWLRACAEPEQPGLLHEALASATLGLSYAELDRLRRDEQAWEEQVERFRALRSHWRRHGVLAAIRRLLDLFDLPGRLLQTVDGERILTNLLHLAELLQTASVQLEGELALVRYLSEQLASGDQSDEWILRLESDSERVQVITIHKSKGLEYPLVYLPFISDCRQVSRRNGYCQYHDDEGRLRLELGEGDEALQRADEERLQEDLRLLYVALTRPVYACWLGLAPLKKLACSALGQLLGGDGETARTRFESLCRPGQIALEAAPPSTEQMLAASDQVPRLRPERHCDRALRGEHWWIASYSALCQLRALDTPADRHVEARDTARDETALETREELSRLPLSGELDDIHRFPKGPAAGTFLHGILEWAAGEGFARVAGDSSVRQRYLAPRCRYGQWHDREALLDRWLERLLNTWLPLGSGASLRLCELHQVQPEMEFWFSVAPLSVSTLDRLLRQQVLPGLARPALEEGQVNGMLKGFIDLVFEHEGRYWVADYKSNWLGADSRSYTRAAMCEAVLGKRYDLQYLLYILALHRLLKARQPDYAQDPKTGYERQVGGALYLFLRGIDEPEQHGAFVDRPPVELILALDQLFECGEQEGAHG